MGNDLIESGVIASIVEMPGIRSMYQVDNEGFLLSSIDTGAGDPDAVAAAIAIVRTEFDDMSRILSLGTMHWGLFEFSKGKVIIICLKNRMWVLFTSHNILLGEVLARFQVLFDNLN